MIQTFRQGRLPHIMPIGATFFTTFHLDGAIPVPLIRAYKQEYADKKHLLLFESPPDIEVRLTELRRAYYRKYDDLLDKQKNGPQHLALPIVRKILADRIMKFDQQYYDTLAFSIMPNHCHWVADFSIQMPENLQIPIHEDNYKQLNDVLKLIKGGTSRYANLELKRTGAFFYHESYDHYVRNMRELFSTIRYTLNNPVKARLVERWQDWEGNYCNSSILSQI